jgi:hypothetical protein
MVIKRLSRRKEEPMRRDRLVEMGGDEFSIVYPGSKKEEVNELARRILTTLSRPFRVAGQEFHITTSIGISQSPFNLNFTHHLNIQHKSVGMDTPFLTIKRYNRWRVVQIIENNDMNEDWTGWMGRL